MLSFSIPSKSFDSWKAFILVMFSIAARFGISSNQFVIVVVLWILGELAFRGFRCLAARSFEGKN